MPVPSLRATALGAAVPRHFAVVTARFADVMVATPMDFFGHKRGQLIDLFGHVVGLRYCAVWLVPAQVQVLARHHAATTSSDRATAS